MNRRPDLLILVAIWNFISAFFLSFGFLVLLIFPAFSMDQRYMGSRVGVYLVFGFAILVLVLLIALSIAAGIGVLRGREWGRITAIVQAVLSLFIIPIGTVAGVLILIYLTRPEVVDYFVGQGTTPPPPPPSSPP